MKVLKVIEVLSSSKLNWEDATKNAVEEAGKSVKGIKSVYIQDMSATVENGKVSEYRINAKITFEVNS
ncbi:MAG: dodecin family protein [Bacteroidales bacterium]|jgi:flavin-binding protein dodecin|nr:dodecin family protein [Bacteroidales bacterium]